MSSDRQTSLARRFAPRVGTRRSRTIWRAASTYLALAFAVLVTLVPFWLSFSTAFTSSKQFVSQGPGRLPAPPVLDNFVDLFGRRVDVGAAFVTTIAVVVVLTVFQLLFSVLAAYAFARLRFPGRDLLFWVFLATLMIPAIVTVVPLFLMLSELKGQFLGLVLPFVFGSPYAIFLLREQFRQVPQELIDAMRIDGASTLRILFGLIVPLSRPILVTLVLITVVSHWNNFLWPLLIGGNRMLVITTATAALQDQYSNNFTLVMAATTLALVPLVILFVIFQRQIVRAITITSFR